MHKHTLHSAVSVKINPQALASELDFCATLRELSNTEKRPLTSLCAKGVWAWNVTRLPGPKTSHDTNTFLPEGIERPFAFLNCTFEGPEPRLPSAKFHGQVCSSQALSSGRNSASTGLLLPSTLRTHVSEVSTPLSSSSDHSEFVAIPASSSTSVSSTAATVAVDDVPSTAWTFLSFASASRFRQSPSCDLSCHSGDIRLQTWRDCFCHSGCSSPYPHPGPCPWHD